LTAPSNSGLINGPQASTAPTSLVPDGSLDGGPAATPVDPAAAKAVANAAPGQSFGSKLMANLTNPDNLASAGLRLGTQMIGGAMSKPDMGPLNSYLNDMQGQQAQANQFNMAQADKKNAVGDKLQVAADNYDPGYMAGLSFANTSNANAMGMQQRVAQARARGASDEEINAMQAEGQVAGTGQANAAWNSGMSSAKGTQAGLYSSAGSMYGQVTPPNASLAGAYSNVAQMNQNAKTAGGYALEQAFQPVTKTTNTGAATT
jgi:hypothetical protein